MAKSDTSVSKTDLANFLKSLPQLPAVYDAKDFLRRPFTFVRVEWRVFEPNDRNNYNTVNKAIIHGVELATGREVVIETTQKGIVNPIGALEAQGLFNVNLVIVQEGKFCTIQAV